MSSDVTADEARAVVAAWVAAQVAADPAFRGAFLTGSITTLPGGALLPRTSDVDVTVVVAAPSEDGATASAPGRRRGKRLVDGLLVDVSYLDEGMFADPARVATSFVFAPSFRGGQVLADPTGHLGHLGAVIAPGFATPAAVRARTADVHRRIRARLTALDPRAAWADLVLHWLFPTSLTAVAALVAALRTPTVRQRYLRAREVTSAAEYQRLLALLGCVDVAPALVERHLDAVAAWFDETAALLAVPGGPPPPHAADLAPAARPVAVDGSRALVDGGHHREAVFWIVATAARCQAALDVRAPDLAESRAPAFHALVADLVGLHSPTDAVTRRDGLLATLS